MYKPREISKYSKVILKKTSKARCRSKFWNKKSNLKYKEGKETYRRS